MTNCKSASLPGDVLWMISRVEWKRRRATQLALRRVLVFDLHIRTVSANRALLAQARRSRK